MNGTANGAANGTVNGVNGNGHGNGNGNGRHATLSVTADADAPQYPTIGRSGEITITRRLYRSGESDYLINGKNARLRDIQDIFSGTGLGPESYAIIEQGRIGQILSNRPSDRRAIIEEAAGIGKFKTKKRLAEAKLESSRQNLSRVFDILEEVGRQVNSLKRQASKARRYEAMRKEMVGHLRHAVAGRFRVLEQETGAITEKLTAAQAAYRELSIKLEQEEQIHTETQQACYQNEAELTAARAQLAELNVESERTRGRLELQARQIGGIDERLQAGEAETQALDNRREQEEARASLASGADRPAGRGAVVGKATPGGQNAGARCAAE